MAYANEDMLAAKVGWPQSPLSRIERGHVDLQLSSLIQLARALGLEPVLVPDRQPDGLPRRADGMRRLAPHPARAACWRKKRSISRLASGPRGSV